jgi:hypothetical protein
MALIVADRVKDSTTTTGTGTLTITGTAPTGYRAFASVAAVGDSFAYCISSATGADWEVGIGTLQSSTTISRDSVLASSNANALVSLSAGTNDVFVTYAAAQTQLPGQDLALALGRYIN